MKKAPRFDLNTSCVTTLSGSPAERKAMLATKTCYQKHHTAKESPFGVLDLGNISTIQYRDIDH